MGRAPWRIPGYRVEELIGVGGYGEVWRGRVRSTGAAVALKRIELSDPAQRQAALSEAALLSALDHPHLVRLHRLVHVDGALVLVLDLASGGTLARLLAARGRLTPGETITALAPVAAALAHAHNAGVVHGDVTAANVLFTALGLPLLADLGVARLLGDHAPARTTPEYADPTVAAGYLPVPASDVFMLGAVAVHTLTGQLPWQGCAPAEPVAAARWREDVEGRLHGAGVAPEMASVLLRALTLEPELRGSAADFALDLRHSGRPVAVELAAGRSRIEPSLARLAAIAAERPMGSSAGGQTADLAPLPASALPFTHGARVPSPLVAREPRHRARERSVALSTPLAVLVTALGLILAAFAWWPAGGQAHSEGPAAAPPPSARSGPVPSRPPGSPGTRPEIVRTGSASWPPDVTQVRRVLAQLDADRSAAFAAREPGRLRGIYRSSALLARDAALLVDAVPAGCGLRGVHTAFTDVRVVGHTADVVLVRARAVLEPSTLVCGDTTTGAAPGAGPTALRIELARNDGGYRIASQRVAG